MQPTLWTRRLCLRPATRDDAPAVVRLAGDRAVADTTLRIPHPYAAEAAEEWIAQQTDDWAGRRGAGFVISLSTGELCGAVGLRIDLAHAHAELGYWIGVPFWRQGYCTEAASELLRFGFAELGLHRIYAHCFSRNPASGRVLVKLGMKHEGRLRQHVRRWDNFEDLECYGLLRAEWSSSRGSPRA